MPLTDREVLDGLIKAIQDHSKTIEDVAASGWIRIHDNASMDKVNRIIDSIETLRTEFNTLTRLWKPDKNG